MRLPRALCSTTRVLVRVGAAAAAQHVKHLAKRRAARAASCSRVAATTGRATVRARAITGPIRGTVRVRADRMASRV